MAKKGVVNLSADGLSNIEHSENEVDQKLKLSKNSIIEKCAPKLVFFIEKKTSERLKWCLTKLKVRF